MPGVLLPMNCVEPLVTLMMASPAVAAFWNCRVPLPVVPISITGGCVGSLSSIPTPLRISEFPLLMLKVNGSPDDGATELNNIVPTVVLGALTLIVVLVPAALLKVATL